MLNMMISVFGGVVCVLSGVICASRVVAGMGLYVAAVIGVVCIAG